MSDNAIKLTREDLYRRMWDTPASRLAKEFGISDVTLGKLCRKFGIPKPYPGYWNQIAAGLIIVADALRVDRLRREEESRRRKEAEQRKYEEESKRQALDPQVTSWIRSEDLRAYLVACEKALIDRVGGLTADSPESRWLRWAYDYADQRDPFKNGDLEKAIKDAQTLETDSYHDFF